MSRSLLFFDVNETLLDLSALDPVFIKLFGSAEPRKAWFAQLLRWSMILTSTGRYQDFSHIAAASLDHIAQLHGVALSEKHRESVFSTIATLPPHADTVAGLERFKTLGYRLFALTNSAQDSLNTQFDNNHLNRFFEKLLSVDSVRLFKPHPRVYQWAAEHCGADIGHCRLIATHEWDVSGAISAGMQGAYLDRGLGVHPLAHAADVQATTLPQLAEAIAALEQGQEQD